jgi:radical SAM superfamily enzyme YgiQ (UPF0313 family)
VPDRATLVLVDARPRRASIAALAGAVEEDSRCGRVQVRIAVAGDALHAAVAEAAPRGPVVVGWSMTTADRARSEAALDALRARDPGPAIHVAGGPHPSADAAGVLAAGFDLAALGEGEETLASLCARVASGDDPRGPGLAWLEGGSIRRGPEGAEVDLDRVPPFAARMGYLGPIEITRGCVHACRFCQTAEIHGARPRHRAPARVARAVSALARVGMRDVQIGRASWRERV